MVVLRAEYAQMKQSAERLAELCKALKKQIEYLKQSTEHLELFWDGEANAAFMLSLEEDFFKLFILQACVNRAVLLLTTVIREYQKTEGIIEQKIGGIRI